MKPFLLITKALSDESRVRALLALRGRELCLCQLIELLGLAPSTVSKHLSLLQQAGLVTRRKEGRWHFYRLPAATAPLLVRRALAWVGAALADDGGAARDAQRLETICSKELEELAACYRS